MRKAIAASTAPAEANLGLHAYWETVGTDMWKKVLERSGTTFSYGKLMAYYVKPCVPSRFERIEKAARELTPGILPDYDTCTRKSVREAALAAKLAAKDAPKVAEQSEAAKRAASRPSRKSNAHQPA